jgi:hypothetical protein
MIFNGDNGRDSQLLWIEKSDYYPIINCWKNGPCASQRSGQRPSHNTLTGLGTVTSNCFDGLTMGTVLVSVRAKGPHKNTLTVLGTVRSNSLVTVHVYKLPTMMIQRVMRPQVNNIFSKTSTWMSFAIMVSVIIRVLIQKSSVGMWIVRIMGRLWHIRWERK